MNLLLTYDELVEITRYKRPHDQLAFLRSRGFHRAEIHRGEVLLERGHYDAVTQGIKTAPDKPKVRLLINPRATA